MTIRYRKPTRSPLLERLHKLLFGFDADIHLHGWSWRYWCSADIDNISPEGDFIAVADGIFCFQRRYIF